MSTAGLAAGRPWAGKWIWAPGTEIDKLGEFMAVPVVRGDACDRRVLFRRELEVPSPPPAAPLRITADSRYVLSVNGAEVGRGPARGHPTRLRFDTWDVAPLLRRGTNVLAVLVRFYGHPTAWWAPAPTTFSHGAGILVAELDLGDEVVGTDAAWRCTRSDAWSPQAAEGVGQFLPEVHDARGLDPAWPLAGFDDSGWPAARVVTAVHLGGTGRTSPPSDPYGPLLPRPTSPLAVRRHQAAAGRWRTAPAPAASLGPAGYVAAATSTAAASEVVEVSFPAELSVAAGETGVLVVDWPRTLSGTVAVDVEAPAGARFDVRTCDELEGADQVPEHHVAQGLRYVARGAEDRFESADPAGGRHTVLVVTGPAAVRLRQLAVVERVRPRPEGPFFECSDPVLNEIFLAGVRTVDATAHDAYVDCASREQRAWTGDSVVHQSVDLLVNPDWSLARWHPELAASPRPDGMLPMAVACDFQHGSPTFIPDWSLHWVRSVHNLYRFTGDEELVARLLPTAESVLRWFEPFLQDGLLTDVTGWVLIDWASVQGRGASAALNGLWARGLADFEEMAEWLGDGGRARWARRRREALVEPFDRFWDDERGGHRDWWRDGEASRQRSDHSTTAGVVGGLLPAGRAERALEFLMDRRTRVRRTWSFGTLPLRVAMGPARPDWDTERDVVEAQPFFRYVVHDAVAALGGAGAVAALCRDWQPFLDAGERTWPETWSGGSHCHGWSSTPTRDLLQYTLGLGPASPGYARARAAPRLGDLAWARGAVPTPAGLLSVEAGKDGVRVSSPVPVDVDIEGRLHRLPAGEHHIAEAM